jgi:hypothetical protein
MQQPGECSQRRGSAKGTAYTKLGKFSFYADSRSPIPAFVFTRVIIRGDLRNLR